MYTIYSEKIWLFKEHILHTCKMRMWDYYRNHYILHDSHIIQSQININLCKAVIATCTQCESSKVLYTHWHCIDSSYDELFIRKWRLKRIINVSRWQKPHPLVGKLTVVWMESFVFMKNCYFILTKNH